MNQSIETDGKGNFTVVYPEKGNEQKEVSIAGTVYSKDQTVPNWYRIEYNRNTLPIHGIK